MRSDASPQGPAAPAQVTPRPPNQGDKLKANSEIHQPNKWTVKNVPVCHCGVTGQKLLLAPGLESSQYCILPSSGERSYLDSGHQASGAVRARQ